MHLAQLTTPELRVLGCLLEKRWTTPDQYPLSLNALRLACNQSTNRDPVSDYDEQTVRQAAERLSRYGLARLASGHGSRAIKYRHLAEEALGLGREQLAILAVLLLRGAQTPGELKGRSERMAHFATPGDVETALGPLIERGYAGRLGRRPGQKEERFVHLLGSQGAVAPDAGDGSQGAVAPDAGDGSQGAVAPDAGDGQPEQQPVEPAANGDLADRVAALEAAVAALRAELEELRA